MSNMSENKTLAQFVQENRDKFGLSALGLSRKANLPLEFLERVEAGEELFLSTTARQKLAKALKCSLDEIKSLEKSFDSHFVSEEFISQYKERILNGEEDLICPKCGAKLISVVDTMYDLEDNIVFVPKARCEKCVFQIK
jgi:transcriptional regulator with XRE-family HTH domain